MGWILVAALAAGVLQNRFLILGALVAIAASVHLHRTPRTTSALVLLTTVLLFFHGLGSRQDVLTHIDHFKVHYATDRRPVVLSGWVATYPSPSWGGVRFQFVTKFDGVEHRLLVRAREFVIDYGDSVQMEVILASRRRVYSDGYFRGLGVCGSARAVPGGVTRLPGWRGGWSKRHVLWPMHKEIRQRMARRLGYRTGIPLALVLGERGALAPKDRAAFRALGLSHLLALSGLHLGFAAGVLIFLTRWMAHKRHIPVLAALLVYVAVVGDILSLHRALLMVFLLVGASALHRPARPMTALVNAFLLMVVASPNVIWSVGFQLSFAATFAVLAAVCRVGSPVRARGVRKMWFWARSTVLVSTVVQIFLLPVLLAYFGEFSVAAPLATALFVFPVMGLLSIAAAAVTVTAICPTWPLPFDLVHWATVLFARLLHGAEGVLPPPLQLPAPNFYFYYAGLALMWSMRCGVKLKTVGLLITLLSWADFVRKF